MPSWERPGRDTPTRRDIQDMERRDRERSREQESRQSRVDAYLRNHPSASYAEAEYRSR